MKTGAFGCKDRGDRIGVLIAQLGTPRAPDRSNLRTYLKQFLWDPRVIEKNRLIWYLVLHGAVLRKRPERSARLYRRIWTAEGSPLMVISKKQAQLVAAELRAVSPHISVALGMRYGEPSLESALDDLIAEGCSRILLFPMYPQYSATTTASTYDVVFSHLLKRRWVPTLRVAEPYYVNKHYLTAQAAVINDAYAGMQEKPDRLVLSYHGIPEEYVTKGDPYCCMCAETTQALLPHLSMAPETVIHTYQSRFGKDPWLEPYTDETIESLAKSGVKKIALAAPGFTADCLETLDELGNEGRELFTEHGGVGFELIPCLNDHPAWIRGMSAIIKEEVGSWIESLKGCSRLECEVNCPVTAKKLGQAGVDRAA